jgi:hypothetical protein
VTEIVANEPMIIHEGVYRLYEKPDGTLRVVYQRDDKPAPDFFEIPGAMIKMMKDAEQGKLSPMDVMRMAGKMMGGGGFGR